MRTLTCTRKPVGPGVILLPLLVLLWVVQLVWTPAHLLSHEHKGGRGATALASDRGEMQLLADAVPLETWQSGSVAENRDYLATKGQFQPARGNPQSGKAPRLLAVAPHAGHEHHPAKAPDRTQSAEGKMHKTHAASDHLASMQGILQAVSVPAMDLPEVCVSLPSNQQEVASCVIRLGSRAPPAGSCTDIV